jgi:hypothetical protein
MAKKKARRKAPVRRVPRKEPYTSERLRGIVAVLREQSARLASLARGIDDAELESISVDGHAMLLRGLNQIENFADNCARAVRESKVRRRA